MKAKLESILAYLGHDLIERDEHLKLALLSILAGENSVLLGPPGTGKSLMARRIADMIKGEGDENGYFEYLLTKFSTPDEIFGPLSIAELKADRFRRNTEKYLPTATIGFLDEIFKSNSSILNSLLTILNERIYHNGAEAQRVPLRALIAASNEVPTDHEELAALYDRFLLRCFVDYVSGAEFERLFEEIEPTEKPARMTLGELESIEHESAKVILPPDVVKAVSRIWQRRREAFKDDRREQALSDRRLKKVIKLIKVSAHTNGRDQADLSDVLLLKNCLWNHPGNADQVRDMVLDVLKGFSRVVELDSESTQQAAEPESTPKPQNSLETGQMNAVVKGFRGKGTAHDPILIGTVEDLMDLARPEVGMQGYYFRQESDIDCSIIESWPKIDFIGHYDGNQQSITTKNKDLFNRVSGNSTISRIKLNSTALATTIEDSSISFCTVNGHYVCDGASNTVFEAIVAEKSLGDATTILYIGRNNPFLNCTIKRCRSGYTMIGRADGCIFEDNIVAGSGVTVETARGGIVNILEGSSSLTRCMASGLNYYSGSGGLVREGNGGTITDCALGRGENSPEKRIIYEANNGIRLSNNVAISYHSGNDDARGHDGRSVDPSLFSQRFFELTLNWDFKDTWYWDDKEDRPELRNIGFDGVETPSAHVNEKPDGTGVDLLTKQINENIWL